MGLIFWADILGFTYVIFKFIIIVIKANVNVKVGTLDITPLRHSIHHRRSAKIWHVVF